MGSEIMCVVLVAISKFSLIKSASQESRDPRFLGAYLLDKFNSEELAKTYLNIDQVHVELADLIYRANLVSAEYVFIFYELEWFVMHYEDNFVETRVLKTLADNGWNWYK